MEKKLTIKIEADASQVQGTVKELSDKIKAAQDNVQAMVSEFGQVSPQAEAAVKAVQDLEVQLKDATQLAQQVTLPKEAEKSVLTLKQRLAELEDTLPDIVAEFGKLSPEAVKAAKEAGKLKEAVESSGKMIDTFKPSGKFNALAGAVNGAVGAFTALQGAQAAFGVQSEEVTKTLAKVQGAMALSQGITSVLEAKDSFRNLAVQMKAIPGIQALITAGQKLWNAAMAANPIGVIVVAITALIAAITALTAWFIKSSDAAKANEAQIKASTKALNDQSKAYERNNAELERNQNFTLGLAKAKGQSADEIRKLELKLADEKIAHFENARQIALNTFYTEQNTLAKQKANGASDEYIKKQQELVNKSLEEANKATAGLQKAYDDRAVLQGQHLIQMEQERTDAAKKEQEKAKENNEKLKKLNEDAQKELIERLKRNAEYQAETEKILQQQRLDTIKEGQYKERLQLDMKHDEDIASIIKYQEDEVKTLDEQLKKKTITEDQYNEQLITVQKNANDRRTAIDEQYNKGIIDINDKYHKIEQQQLTEHLQKLNDIQQGTAEIQNQNKLNLISNGLQDQFNLEVDYQKQIDEALKILDDASLGSQEERQKIYNERRAAIDEQYQQKKTGLSIERANAEVTKIMADGEATLSAQRAALDASDALLEESFNKKKISEDQYTANVKKNADARKKIDDIERENKRAQVRAISGILTGLSDLVGKQTKVGKAAAIAGLLVQQGQNVASIVSDTRKAVMADQAASPTTFGMPWAAFHIAQGALSVAGAIKATKQGIADIKAAGDGGSGGGAAGDVGNAPSGSAPMPATPEQTILPQAQIDQIASANAATRAYVLESDVSSNQERIIRLNRAARIN